MEKENSSLLGPLMADSLEENDSIIKEYIISNGSSDVTDDKYISSILGDERVVISGVRGTGKTMILKVANEVIKNDLEYKLHYVNEWDLSEKDKKVLPVFISFSGFKDEVSLQDESTLVNDDIRSIKEIFRSYFFITILQEILGTIENLRLDEEVEFNFFGFRTNTKGTIDDVTPAMKKLLDFIDGKEPQDDFTRELDEAVRSVRKNEKWRALNVQWTFA